MSQEIYRAAAIGHTGAGNYGHGLHLGYKSLQNVKFIAIADPDEAGRQAAIKETGAVRGYADYHDMLEKEELDIVSVCPRWMIEHVDMVMACLDANCHVYCEKPIAASLSDGDGIVKSADEKGLKLAVAHGGVYRPKTQSVKEMLENGRIGNIQKVHIRGLQDRRGGGEDMLTLGTHVFNTARYFFGAVEWMHAHVTVDGRPITIADACDATEPVGPIAGDCVNSYFAFKNGVTGFFDSRKDQIDARGGYGMQIFGSEGILSFGATGDNDLSIYPYPCWVPTDMSRKWETVPITNPASPSVNQLAIMDLIDAIEHDRKPLCSGEDAVAALEMVLGAYESQLTERRIYFPMQNREHPLKSD